jgi:alkylhydroperoxidase family enzyme
VARIDLPGGEGLDVGRALLLAPHFVDVVVGYEKAVAHSTLAPRLHELVRYRVAQLNQCTVCLDFRRPDSGLTEQVLAEVASYRDSAALTFMQVLGLDQACTLDPARLAGVARQ